MIGVLNHSVYNWRLEMFISGGEPAAPIIGEQITTEGGTSITTEGGTGITTEEPV